MIQKLKPLFIGCGALALLAGGTVLTAPLLVDEQAVTEKLKAAVNAQTGLTLNVEGSSSVSAYPAPSITYTKLEVRDGEAVIATIPALTLDIGWAGLLSESASALTLYNAQVTLSPEQMSRFAGSKAFAADALSLPKINATIQLDKGGNFRALDAALRKHGQPVSIAIIKGAADSITTKLRIGDLLQAQLDGSDAAGTSALMQGDISLKSPDLLALSRWLHGKEAKEKPGTAPDTKAAASTYPLDLTSTFSLSQDHLTIHRSEADFMAGKTKLAAHFGWRNHVVFALDIAPESLKLDKTVTDFASTLLPSVQVSSGFVAPVIYDPIPSYFSLLLMTDIEKASIGQHQLRDVQIMAEYMDGDVRFHQADAAMAGDAKLALSGILKQLPEGRRFSGQARMQGKQFNQWLAAFEPLAAKLPKEDFSDFIFNGNVFISKEQLRLSEARIKIGELDFKGGFAAFFDQIPRVEAEIGLQNINLDYFRNLANRAGSDDKPAADSGQEVANFDWLRRLPAVLDFRINIRGLTFLDQEGSLASVRLYARPGELTLSGIDVRLKNNVINGNASLDVRQRVPQFNATASVSRFNTDYFSRGQTTKRPPFFNRENADNRWSKQLFDFGLLNHANGTMDLSLGSLIHLGDQYRNVKLKAVLENRKLDIKKMSLTLLDGSFALQGMIVGGDVPGISASFSLYNADLKNILSRLLGYDFITGRLSVSGVIGTSGISPKAWLEQADIKLTTAARGVRVRGFNLGSVTAVSKVARSTQDVEQGIRERLFDGMTELSVDGNINIAGGKMQTPGMRLGFGRTLGTLNGEIDLLNWRTNISTFWQFPELSGSTIPTMTMTSQGTVDDFKTRLDTSSLEAFVAKKIVGQ